MKNSATPSHENYPDTHHDVYSKTVFGFWLYILTDFMLFATLFATYAVLRNSTFGGPSARDLFNLDYTLIQTLFFLSSSFTIGLAAAFAHRKKKWATIALFATTFFLGMVFFGMELSEMTKFVREGFGWHKSAFLSAYFTLIGTHALHMAFALLWIIVLIVPVFFEGITPVSIKRLTCLKMFWQFLNIIWVFIFTIVYLIGA